MMAGGAPKKAKDAIEMDGIVTESLPNAMFRVELEANKVVCWPPYTHVQRKTKVCRAKICVSPDLYLHA
jgi:translation initiation factor IF-1